MSIVVEKGDVDTKSAVGGKFGNDNGAVDTNYQSAQTIGNDAKAVGFIRVRKRRLKGGHKGWAATESASYDVVRAVRVNGKPRHQFILGLGSQKHPVTGRMAAYFLLLAIGRMKRHGLTEAQRHTLLAELIRKGARRPTITECEDWRLDASWTPYVNELAVWLRAAP